MENGRPDDGIAIRFGDEFKWDEQPLAKRACKNTRYMLLYYGVKSSVGSKSTTNAASRSAAWSRSSSEIVSTALCM